MLAPVIKKQGEILYATQPLKPILSIEMGISFCPQLSPHDIQGLDEICTFSNGTYFAVAHILFRRIILCEAISPQDPNRIPTYGIGRIHF
jgi:hypothetical protein